MDTGRTHIWQDAKAQPLVIASRLDMKLQRHFPKHNTKWTSSQRVTRILRFNQPTNHHSRDQLVQALGLSFTVSTLALAAGLAWRGGLGGGELNASLLALLPALLGMWLGQVVRQRISAQLFKRVFFIGMALLGGHLLING